MSGVVAWLGKWRTSLILLCGAVLLISVLLGSVLAPAHSQAPRRVSPSATSAQIYQRYPDIPLENQYTSSETGSAATENTLVSRLIRYHVYLKRRNVALRLDWKLTMADYLGVFDQIRENRYLDSGLQENPLAGDVAAIEAMSIEERDRLVNALYESFTSRPDSDRASDLAL